MLAEQILDALGGLALGREPRLDLERAHPERVEPPEVVVRRVREGRREFEQPPGDQPGVCLSPGPDSAPSRRSGRASWSTRLDSALAASSTPRS